MALLHCGFTSSRVISTLYALNYGQPAWMVGVILSTYAAIPALISIHVGKFIDKIGVRIPITVSFLMISAACLMPILFPYEKFGFWPIIVTSLLAGTGFVFTLISGQGLIGHLSNNKNRAIGFYLSIHCLFNFGVNRTSCRRLSDRSRKLLLGVRRRANLCTPRRRNLSVPGAGPALGL